MLTIVNDFLNVFEKVGIFGVPENSGFGQKLMKNWMLWLFFTYFVAKSPFFYSFITLYNFSTIVNLYTQNINYSRKLLYV